MKNLFQKAEVLEPSFKKLNIPEKFLNSLYRLKALSSEQGQIIIHAKAYFTGNKRIQISPDTFIYNLDYNLKCKMMFAYNIEVGEQEHIQMGAPEGYHSFTMVFNSLPKKCRIFHFKEEPKNGSTPLYYFDIFRTDNDVYTISEED